MEREESRFHCTYPHPSWRERRTELCRQVRQFLQCDVPLVHLKKRKAVSALTTYQLQGIAAGNGVGTLQVQQHFPSEMLWGTEQCHAGTIRWKGFFFIRTHERRQDELGAKTVTSAKGDNPDNRTQLCSPPFLSYWKPHSHEGVFMQNTTFCYNHFINVCARKCGLFSQQCWSTWPQYPNQFLLVTRCTFADVWKGRTWIAFISCCISCVTSSKYNWSSCLRSRDQLASESIFWAWCNNSFNSHHKTKCSFTGAFSLKV